MIAVTAVGANVKGRQPWPCNNRHRIWALTETSWLQIQKPQDSSKDGKCPFPPFLVDNEDMGIDLHGWTTSTMGESIVNAIPGPIGRHAPPGDAILNSHTLMLTKFEADDPTRPTGRTPPRTSATLSFENAEPISFNHLTGNFTEALTSTTSGGADQTASWGGTPVIRPAVDNTDNDMGANR